MSFVSGGGASSVAFGDDELHTKKTIKLIFSKHTCVFVYILA